MDIVRPTDEPTAAETGWRAVVDAQRDDLALMRSLWPQTKAPAFLAARERLELRAAPGGAADEAMGAVHAAYGGRDHVPPAVRERLERYVDEQLKVRPLPDDLAARPRYRPATRSKGGHDGR